MEPLLLYQGTSSRSHHNESMPSAPFPKGRIVKQPLPSILHSQVPDCVQPGVRLAPPSESAEETPLAGAASISRALAVVSGSMEADTTPASGKPSPPFESSAPMTAAPCCVSGESTRASDEPATADASPCPPCVAVAAEPAASFAPSPANAGAGISPNTRTTDRKTFAILREAEARLSIPTSI